jgi:hypothetical protein
MRDDARAVTGICTQRAAGMVGWRLVLVAVMLGVRVWCPGSAVASTCVLGETETALKHSLPAIRRKCKQQEHLGSLTKHYRSTGRALTKRNNTPSCMGLGNKSLSRKPQWFPKLSSPTQGKERQEELKALELKGETGENSVLLN